ncbi:GumC domain-containing protein [Tautonia rosea]|uniref:hypothetical protein n=1 Tax=Tautonia rosea TaxID=2728037 RepID=UPI0014739811|nr:hypothetical protein [Tautonia rosea]
MISLIVGLFLVFTVKVVIYPDPYLSSARAILSSFNSPAPPTAVLLYTEKSDPFEESPPDWESTQRNFQNTVQLITSARTVSQVLLSSEIVSITRIRNAKNPEQLLRNHIEVRRPNENALLIEISAPGFPRAESVAIVNKLAEAFIELQDELANARTTSTINELERSNANLESQLQEHLERLAELDQIPLEPDGPTLSRPEIEAEFRTCLEHLRRVQLDRAALPPNAEEDALAPLDRQMAKLLAERDRLAAAIARAKASEPERLLQQHSIDNLLEFRTQIQKSLMRANFLSNSSGSRWIVVSKAQ